MAWLRVATDLGEFHVESDGQAITNVTLPGSPRTPHEDVVAATTDPLLVDAAAQVKDYVQGRRTEFTFPVRLAGTPFQQTVWNALRQIPYGETRSYGDIAAAIGKPGAARAVGQANNRNHLPLVVPCHRVLAAGGALGGYDGGEALKADLLRLEGAWIE